VVQLLTAAPTRWPKPASDGSIASAPARLFFVGADELESKGKRTMNGYLVLLRGLTYDFPISLHETEEEAEFAAMMVWQDPDKAKDETLIEIGHEDEGNFTAVEIIHFQNGRPVSLKLAGGGLLY
jgi:hypothetical protein